MSNLSDLVGGADLFNGSKYSYTYDRFNNSNSAIDFNRGYLQVPPGNYFSGDFTFTAWIYLYSYEKYSRIIDFGNGDGVDNVILTMHDTTSQIQGLIVQGINKWSQPVLPSLSFGLNQWYFISYVLNGTTGYIYVNGNQVANNTMLIPNNIVRASNYIGKSNFASDANTNATYDEIKIYKGALTSDQIINEYNSSSNNGKLFLK